MKVFIRDIKSDIFIFLLLSTQLVVSINQTVLACCNQPSDTVWDVKQLFKTPNFYVEDNNQSQQIKSLYYEALSYKGSKTRVFAWLGFPKKTDKEKVPAVVCVHGGGGTAFKEWVEIWNKHGYAAIAMDLEGTLPEGKYPNRSTHEFSGPKRNGIFNDINQPIEDQWMYHAVADVILAHSLIRSFPQVDASRVGLTGISWGGIVSNIVVGVDSRFSFAIPVYGCSYLFESDNNYENRYKQMCKENAVKCKRLWDGSNYLANAKMPMLWINGTNDKHFYPHIFQKSFQTPVNAKILYFKVGMKHGHKPGWETPEIYAFADSIVNSGKALVSITDQGQSDNIAWVSFKGQSSISKVILNYTLDTGIWYERKWLSLDVNVDASRSKATAVIPDGTTAYFFNITDERDLTVSSEYREMLLFPKKNEILKIK